MGAEFEEDVRDLLDKADELVVLFTPWSLERPYGWAEIGAAWIRRIPNQWSLRPGDKWQERMQEALRESRIFCVVVGASKPETPWSYFEIGAALADQKIIVPVLSKDARSTDLPPILSRYQTIGERTPVEAAAKLAMLVEVAGTEA